MSLYEIAAPTTTPAASLGRALMSRFRGVTDPSHGRVEPPSMTLVNLSGHVLRLVRIEGSVAADRMPPLGVVVRRGEELSFGVARGLDADESVVAHFELVDAPRPGRPQAYPVAISAGRSARSLAGATGAPLTPVHLTQDHIVLRSSADERY